ncbi:DUF1707 SHOCT-like domain-containing protein [Streptomyces tardus]|uniref:DUF1707 SHOCT-like domain-containing protein n=1 Tax=Streptomyces tardus TaxID=2780544 RepID=UPI0027E581AC|nr:DUF1707 domain-containing protein [Streptomyces tardus]
MEEISLSKQPAGSATGPEVRVSDADRDRVAHLLRLALSEGRLNGEEYAERVESAYAAKTAGQLESLLADLPVGRRAPAPGPRTLPTRTTANLVAIFGGAVRKGRWRAGGRINVLACFGGVEIDLTEALYDYPRVDIHVTALFGGVDIRVPENVTLRGAGHHGVFGGFEVAEQEASDPRAPVVVVHGFALFAGAEAKGAKGRRIRDLRALRD